MNLFMLTQKNGHTMNTCEDGKINLKVFPFLKNFCFRFFVLKSGGNNEHPN